MTLHIIAALDRRGAIGRGGDMLFHLRDDLRRFKAITMGNALIMGRKTFESLPAGALPGRRNIVLTRNVHWSAPGVETVHSLAEAISLAGDGDVFVIGGGEIYAAAMPLADVLDITLIDAEAEDADTFFPVDAIADFEEVEREACASTPPCEFVTYRRK